MSDLVIREVTKDIWIFSRPFARFGLLPFGGRSTAIKLRDGSVWVLASTLLDDQTKAKLDEIGPVKYIIGADAVHYLYLNGFKKVYPDAKLVGVEAALSRTNDKTLKFDGAWGRDPPNTKYGFEDDIKACYFSGYRNKDVAFLHSASKTMIQADLLLNLPGNEQYSKTNSSPKLPIIGKLNYATSFYPKMLYSLGTDKEAMRRDVKTVADWDFDRIIPCHGDVIETDGNKIWREAYKHFLN